MRERRRHDGEVALIMTGFRAVETAYRHIAKSATPGPLLRLGSAELRWYDLASDDGVPEATQSALAALGWPLGKSDGGFGGYQAIERLPGRYAAASEMRKDGVALAW